MAQRKRTPKPPAEEAAPETTEVQAETPLTGVLVAINRSENGDVSLNVQGVGDVRPTEFETVLANGLEEWRQSLGRSSK